MAGIMYLGNQMVSPVIVQGNGGGAFNVDVNDWIGTVNEQGVLVKDTKDINLVFDGVKELSNSLLQSKFYADKRVKSASFPDLESITGANALKSCLAGTSVSSVNFPKLKTISGNNAFESCYPTNTPIVNFEFPELETITGSDTFLSCCNWHNTLKKISFPKLKTAGYECFHSLAIYSGNIEEVNFPSLETAGNGAFYEAFEGGSSPLTTVNFNSLQTAGDNCFDTCFAGTQIESVSFPLLSSIGSNCFNSSFDSCFNLKTLYFNSLNSNSFGQNTNCFKYMLYDCENVVVHFPVGLDATIGNWPDVLAGFDGIDTTILYDL